MLSHSPTISLVDQALKDARSVTFRGNTFGQLDCYYKPSASDRRIADRFDVSAALEQAIRQRQEAGIQDHLAHLA
jgi:hypothetical protein